MSRNRTRRLDRMREAVKCICWMLPAVLAGSAFAGQGYDQAGVSIQAKTIKLSRATNSVEASGDVRLSAADPAARVKLTAEALRVTVKLLAVPGKSASQRGLDLIKQAEFGGPVKMVYVAPKTLSDEAGGKSAEVMVRTTASADSAAYDGLQGIATLAGNVKIVQEDPSIFAEPAVMTGDKAVINLRRGQETGDYDFKIESSGKLSRIEIVPKQQTKR